MTDPASPRGGREFIRKLAKHFRSLGRQAVKDHRLVRARVFKGASRKYSERDGVLVVEWFLA
jgi:hypothetical protein